MKIILPQKPWRHDIGDFVYGNPIFLSNVDLKETENKDILLLSFINENYWRALSVVIGKNNGTVGSSQVDKIIEKFTYRCRYTDRDYIAVLPIAIITNDINKYLSIDGLVVPWLHESLNDQKWIKHFYPLSEFSLSSISKCILGTGYEKDFIVEDGCFSNDYSKMEMDNGDFILCVNLVWHNK